jgi:hypothetical protein
MIRWLLTKLLSTQSLNLFLNLARDSSRTQERGRTLTILTVVSPLLALTHLILPIKQPCSLSRTNSCHRMNSFRHLVRKFPAHHAKAKIAPSTSCLSASLTRFRGPDSPAQNLIASSSLEVVHQRQHFLGGAGTGRGGAFSYACRYLTSLKSTCLTRFP